MALVEKEMKDGVCHLTLNRPDHNLLNTDLLEELSHLLVKLDREALAVVLQGGGKSFCGGADLKELYEMSSRQLRNYAVLGKKICAQIEGLSVPTIAALHGHCIGEGIELTMCCDLRLASEKTSFEFPQVRNGYTPGFGATRTLPALIGRSRAMELLLTSANFDAKTAAGLGLITKTLKDKNLHKKAHELAALLASRNPIVVSSIKQLLGTTDVVKETSAFADQASAPDTKLILKELLG